MILPALVLFYEAVLWQEEAAAHLGNPKPLKQCTDIELLWKSRDFPCSHLNSLWLLHLQQKSRAVCVRAGRRWGCLSRAVVRVWSTMAQQLILPRDTAWARAQGSITLIKNDALMQRSVPSRADPQGCIQLPMGTRSPGHR